MSIMLLKGENFLDKVKEKTSLRLTQLKESLRYLQQDREAGENVDDTEVRRKITILEEFYSRHFGLDF